jgi:hypothetical protein
LAAISLLSTASAFATTLNATAGQSIMSTGDGKLIGKLSQGVSMNGTYDTTGYAFVTAHAKGSKAYGTSSNATSIFSQDYTPGATVPTPSTSDSSAFTSWSVQ